MLDAKENLYTNGVNIVYEVMSAGFRPCLELRGVLLGQNDLLGCRATVEPGLIVGDKIDVTPTDLFHLTERLKRIRVQSRGEPHLQPEKGRCRVAVTLGRMNVDLLHSI